MPLFFQQDIDDSTKLAIWKIEEEEAFFHVPLQREITHPHKRLQHLAGRYLLKYLFPDFPTELIRIADTRKPFLEDEKYHFSISHCGDFAAVIVSSVCRVGIDVEVISEKPVRIMNKFLNAEEMLIVNCSRRDAVGQDESSIANNEPLHPEGRMTPEVLLKNETNACSEIDVHVDKMDPDIPETSPSDPQLTVGLTQATNPKLPTPNPKPQTPNPRLLTLFWSAKEAMFKWWGHGKVDFSEMLLLSDICEKDQGSMQGRFVKDLHDIAFPVHYKMFDGIVMAWVKTDPGVFDR